MRLSFRAKLMSIVGGSALAFLVIIIVSIVTAQRVAGQLAALENRHLPKLELEPKLEGHVEKLRRGFQDAVAARDLDALERTRATETALLDELGAARDIIGGGGAAALRTALEEYYAAAHDVSRRIIEGETGEPLVDGMALMQAKQARLSELLKQTTAFDRAELTSAFEASKRAQSEATRARLIAVVLSLAFVLGLSMWLSRGAISALASLTAGFVRFGKGEFEHPIEVTTRDELADLAEHANAMAASLGRVDAERERSAWLKTGQAGLASELRGELEPADVADRAISFLARYLDAPAAAVYIRERDGRLHLLGRYAHSSSAPDAGAASFGPAEGLVGQAALVQDITVITDPPDGYFRVRSGLGDAPPRAIVLLPLVREDKVTGVIELALFKPWSERSAELLVSVRESVAIAIEVARARAAMRALLAETQDQARRLSAQEERLVSANEELQTQQEELRQINDELTTQTRALDVQRHGLEEKNGELQEARRGLERKADELASVSAYKSQFLANMSHELRTPLNSMLLLSQLLAENQAGNLTDKQVEYAKTVFGAGNDLLALINQVLDLAKVEAGKQVVRIEDVSLRDLADHARRVFGPLANRKGLAFIVEVAPDLPETVATDRQRAVQILNNLLANAIKFTDRGEVALRIGHPTPGAVAFTVSDTGVGIAPEHRGRVFAPFEQVEASSDRKYGGTGLGLSIARELAALLGGELQLTNSARGEGSTFVWYLPIGAAPARHSSASVVDDRAVLAPGDDHLLIIEDDPVFAEVLGEVIHGYGLRYVLERDGQSGLSAAKERRPSGIILDIKLPDVDGWRVMEMLRADQGLASIPVHFVSAVDASERGIAYGAVGYLTKPASRQDLVRVVECLAPPRKDQTCPILIVEDAASADASLMRALAGESVQARRVGSAREALEVVGTERFACIILDLALPDMDGLDLLESLAAQCGPDMPSVLVYTSRPLSKPEAKRLESYADAVIVRGGASSERLVDEIRLFVRRLKEGLGSRRADVKRSGSSDITLAGRRVLLVDDDMRTVYALSAALRAKGVDVTVGDTGRAALAALNERPDIEAVLMDIMMPELDGYEATRQIRLDPRFRTLPIIALTAKAMKGDREKCLEAGASDYLSKPIDAAQLLLMLHSWLTKARSDAS